MDNDPRYTPVAQTLPPVLPPITRVEAERAARLLIRHFGGTRHGSALQTAPVRFRRVRRCWISSKPTKEHHKGWGRLVHDVSHSIFRARHPGFRPHDTGHALLEQELAAFVVGNGWLNGTLKKEPPTKADVRATKLARTQARLAAWSAKLRRAQNAVRKLERRQRALERAVSIDC